MTNIFGDFRRLVIAALDDLAAQGDLPSGLDFGRVAVEPPRDPAHGDLSTNAAMVLARDAKQNPMALAERIAASLSERELESAGYKGSGFTVTATRPGFINVRLDPAVWHAQLRAILRAGAAYGDTDLGGGERVNVEFVSANPTGPMHVGHGRGAVFGDALAALLAKAGFAVHREYYINDAGAQVDLLARSTYLRYREALGETVGPIPEGFYPGEYLVATGRALAERDGDKWRGRPEAEWLGPVRDFAVAEMMRLIRGDLAALGVAFRRLHLGARAGRGRSGRCGAGSAVRARADLRGRARTAEGQVARRLGAAPADSVPRDAIRRRGGPPAQEIGRLLDLFRGGHRLSPGQGAPRLSRPDRCLGRRSRRLRQADAGGGSGAERGEGGSRRQAHPARAPFRQWRAGAHVEARRHLRHLREVVDEVGKDVFRFIMLTRKNDQTLEFDFAKVTEQSKDNPVFYVQYAHARAASVMRHAAELLPEAALDDAALVTAPLDRLADSAELGLVRLLAGWPRIVASAAEAHEPHRIAFFLQDVAAQFHLLWTKGKDDATLRFLVAADPALTRARLALVRGVALVIASGLAVFGVEPVEEM